MAGVNEAPARCSDGEVAVPSGDGNDHGLQDLQDVDAATNDTSELRYPRLKKNLKSSGVRPSEPVPLDDVDAPRQGRPLQAHVPQPLEQERHGDHELGDHELHVLEVDQTAMEGERRKGKRRQKRSVHLD